MAQKKLHVAMLEDDTDDRYLTEEILAEVDMNLQLDFYTNSYDLLESITQVKPNLILIDYNSTPENGIQLLKRLKGDPQLRGIPAVILSDNSLPKYSLECYEAGASTFIAKPASLEESKKKINTFFTYWSQVAES